MPRNSQGLYTLPPSNPVAPNTLIEAAWANTTMEDIGAALTGSLPRDGSAPMTGPLILKTGQPTQPREAVSKAYLEQFLAYATGMPVGAVFAFASGTTPPGYLLCNGQAVSRATYATLFTAIGVIYGSGDGTTTFNVPDLRNEFVRGKPDLRALGNKQGAAFASHNHGVADPGHTHGASGSQTAHAHVVATNPHGHGVVDPGHNHSGNVGTFASAGFAGGAGLNVGSIGAAVTGISIATAGNIGGTTDSQQPVVGVTVAAAVTGVSTGVAGGDETRPQNIALDYYIKAIDDAALISGVTGITSSDDQMISINNTNPVSPELVIHSNVAFGTVKLDASGQVPLGLLPSSSQQLLGYWNASGGQTPSQASPSTNYASGDTYIISVTGTLTVYDPVTLTASPTVVAVGSLIQYIENSVTNPTGWYYVVASSTVAASQVSFTPAGNVVATNVQAAIVEVDGDVVANTGAIAALNNALNLLDTAAVKKSSLTGAAFIPAGTTAQRDTAQLGAMRYNTQLDLFEGVTSAGWGTVGGGITQSQADARYLQLTGGTLTGNLTAVANYVSSTQATAANALTRKDWVEANFAKPGDVGAVAAACGVTWNGNAVILNSFYRVGSVVRTGVGTFTVNFNPALPDNKYSATVTAANATAGILPTTVSGDPSSFQLAFYSLAGALTDPSGFSVNVVRTE